MQSVSSNAVYNAIGGSKINKKNVVITLTNSDLANYGYKSVSIPNGINNDNILSIFFYTPSISASQGLQITPLYCGGGLLYFTYIKPATISETLTYTIEIYYYS